MALPCTTECCEYPVRGILFFDSSPPLLSFRLFPVFSLPLTPAGMRGLISSHFTNIAHRNVWFTQQVHRAVAYFPSSASSF